MFFSNYIFNKKGPLGKVWLAAHWDSRMSKSMILSTDVSQSAESILRPEVPLALRLSGHLLLGLARIYLQQVNMLYTDCNNVISKIKSVNAAGDVNISVREEKTSRKDVDRPAARADAREYRALDETFAVVNLQDVEEGDDMWLPAGAAAAAAASKANMPSIRTFDGRPSMPVEGTDDLEAPHDDFGDNQDLYKSIDDIEFVRGPDDTRGSSVGLGRMSFAGTDGGGSLMGGRSSFAPPDMSGAGAGVDDGLGNYGNPNDNFDYNGGDVYEPADVQVPQQDVDQPMLFTEDTLQLDASAVTQKAAAKGESKKRTREPAVVVADASTKLHSTVLQQWLEDTTPIVAPRPSLIRRARQLHSVLVAPARLMTPEARFHSLSSAPVACQPLQDAFAVHTSPSFSLPYPRRTGAEASSAGAGASLGDGSTVGGASFAQPPDDYQFDAGDYEPNVEPPVYEPPQPESPRAAPALASTAPAPSAADASFTDGPDASVGEAEGGDVSDARMPVTGKWHPRTVDALRTLDIALRSKDSVKFVEVTKGMNRKAAARGFFELLVLKSWDCVNVEQAAPFAEISISKTSKFADAVRAVGTA